LFYSVEVRKDLNFRQLFMPFKEKLYVERKMNTKHKILLTVLILLCLISVSSVAMAATPTANFKANTVIGTAPLKITFSDLSTGSPSSWRWNFGDGIESSTRNATHTYTKAGKYTVKLTVKNSSGSNTATKTGYITVTAGSTTVKPVAAFHSPEADLLLSGTTDNVEIDASDVVSFVDDSTGSPTSWSWNFGDGNTSTGKNPTHVYGKQGGYTVTLTVKNSAGSDTITRTCYVLVGVGSILPHAIDFTSTETIGKAPFSVIFTDLSDPNNNIYARAWDFGDGTTGSVGENGSASITHIYEKPGKYTVTLRNYDGGSSGGAVTKYQYITVTEEPTAAFHSPEAERRWAMVPTDEYSINATDVISFVDDSTGSPTSWSWNFGDGNTSTEKNPTHVYGKQGGYTVTLTVKNSAGVDTKTKTGYIPVGIYSYAIDVIDFTAQETNGEAPFTVTFTDISGQSAYGREWDFGDGVVENTGEDDGNSVSHTYEKAGKYTVNLKDYTGGGSGILTKYQYITVTEGTASKIPVPDFTVNKTSGTYPLTVKFTDLSTNNPTSVRWYFGDGIDSSTRNATHTYTKAGTYAVKLVANNSYGSNSITKTEYITVTAPKAPVAVFSASVTSGKAPLKVTFADQSTGNPTSWKWTFGDGITSTTQNATHTFTKAGKYTVSLTVKNAVGSNTKTTTSYITVTK